MNNFSSSSISFYSSNVISKSEKHSIRGLTKYDMSSVGCDWLRMCQSWTADQRSCGRDIRQAAHPTQLLRGREEAQPLFGRSGGENLIKNTQNLISTGKIFNEKKP